jgi:transcriptional regulator with XRE-family HTH domain
MLDFYERFTAICKSKSISRSSIIKKAGLSTTNLTYWKKGAFPKLETVENLANALEVSVEQLLGINSPTTHFMDFMMQEVNLNVQLQ